MRIRQIALALVATAGLFAGACEHVETAPVVDASPWPGPVPPPPPPPPRIQFTKYLAFGDSLAEGFLKTAVNGDVDPRTPGPITGFPFKLLTSLVSRYVDQTFAMYDGGVGGRRAEWDVHDDRLGFVLNQLPAQPEVMILLEGVNDLFDGSNVPKVVNFLQQLVNEAQSRGIRVLVSTLPPERDGTAPGNAVVADFNNTLKAKISGATVVDVNPSVTPAMIGPDGLHLLEIGNQTLSDVYFAKLMELFEIPLRSLTSSLACGCHDRSETEPDQPDSSKRDEREARAAREVARKGVGVGPHAAKEKMAASRTACK